MIEQEKSAVPEVAVAISPLDLIVFTGRAVPSMGARSP
jgi:hypothetical protein